MRRVPFLSLPGRIVATRDSQAFAETVSLMLRLQDCDSLLPAEPFASRTGVVQLGQVSVLATSGSPIHAVAEAVEQSTFMLPYQDCDGDYSIEGKPYSNNYGGNILHIPPVGWTLQSQSPMGAGFSRACITFLASWNRCCSSRQRCRRCCGSTICWCGGCLDPRA